jgi:hypothetical protein
MNQTNRKDQQIVMMRLKVQVTQKTSPGQVNLALIWRRNASQTNEWNTTFDKDDET